MHLLNLAFLVIGVFFGVLLTLLVIGRADKKTVRRASTPAVKVDEPEPFFEPEPDRSDAWAPANDVQTSDGIGFDEESFVLRDGIPQEDTRPFTRGMSRDATCTDIEPVYDVVPDPSETGTYEAYVNNNAERWPVNREPAASAVVVAPRSVADILRGRPDETPLIGDVLTQTASTEVVDALSAGPAWAWPTGSWSTYSEQPALESGTRAR